jgi:putative two-component system response regulator
MESAAATGSRILVVDDNPSIALLLQHVLTAEGYHVAIARDGLEGLARVVDYKPDLIFLDLNLPHLNGYEVCRRLKSDPVTRLTPIVMITAQTEFQSKLNAWEQGADEFLTKPFQLLEVSARCRSLLRIKRLVEERDSAENVIFALARTVEAKSPYTHGHSERVKDYALALAAEMDLTAEQREILRKGALLHDIGKISVPDAILNKPGPLTPEEYEVIKDHVRQGAHIVEPLRSMQDALPLIRSHHERLDGQGYPDGLKGEAIPLLVRILSVADIFDSLASCRPYREPIPPPHCLEMLRDNALHGGLDPELVALFSRVVDQVQSSIGQLNRYRSVNALSPNATSYHSDVVLRPGVPAR